MDGHDVEADGTDRGRQSLEGPHVGGQIASVEAAAAGPAAEADGVGSTRPPLSTCPGRRRPRDRLRATRDNEGFKRWMTDRVFELACEQAGAR